MPTPISGALRLFGNLGFLPTGVNESITIAATTFLGEETGGASTLDEANLDPNTKPSRPSRPPGFGAWIERPAPPPAPMAKHSPPQGDF